MDAGEPRLPLHPVIGVSTAVIRGDSVLLVQRGPGAYADCWTLPGGKVEPGEKLSEAARRELAEETGVAASMAGIADVIEILGDGLPHFVVIVFAAIWKSGEPVAADDAEDARWATFGEIAGLDTTPGLAEVIEKARAFLRDELSPV